MKKVLFGLVGPTASGKTKITMKLAEKFKFEIVSCDSMQIYKGMDIGTAKASIEELQKVPHHMIDIIYPEEEFSVADYSIQARNITFDILKRDKIPFLTGGSGLYYNSYVDGIVPEAQKDAEFRNKMSKIDDNAVLYSKLKKTDTEAAKKIHPNDRRRIIRALEVYHVTGKTITSKKKEKISLEKLGFNLNIYALKLPREILYNSITKRVDNLIENGLLEEAKKLKKKNLSLTAKKAIGYKEIYSYLEGNETFNEAVENIKQYTRNYARRQMTWFKKRKEIKWIEIESLDDFKKAVDIISGDLDNFLKKSN